MLGYSQSRAILDTAEQASDLAVSLSDTLTVQDLAECAFNPYLGVSLGNRLYADKNNPQGCIAYIKDCLRFGLGFAREGSVAALVGDELHYINLMHADGYSEPRARKVAARLGDEMVDRIKAAVGLLPAEDRGGVRIVRWREACDASPHYHTNIEIIRQTYAENQTFATAVRGIVGEMVGKRVKPIDPVSQEKLSEYILQELAVFPGGIRSFGQDGSQSESKFDLLMYPSLGPMQSLIRRLEVGSEDTPHLELSWASQSIGLARFDWTKA